MTNNLEFHIDFVLINLNKVRITALEVFVLAVVYMVTSSWIVAAFLILDFGTRALKLEKFSLLNGISNTIIDFGGIETIPVNQAPKVFAARIGFALSLLVLAAGLTGFVSAARIIGGILALFAFLESIKGFCAGCYLYSHYIRIFSNKKTNKHAQSKPHQ